MSLVKGLCVLETKLISGNNNLFNAVWNGDGRLGMPFVVIFGFLVGWKFITKIRGVVGSSRFNLFLFGRLLSPLCPFQSKSCYSSLSNTGRNYEEM